MPNNNDDDDRDPDELPFTATERAELRRLMESERRAKWLWGSIRVWALWVTAVVAAVTVGREALKAAARSLLQ